MKRVVIFFAGLLLAMLLFALLSCTAVTTPAASPTPAAYLPIASNTHSPAPSGDLLQPADLQYAGAFRLPDVGDRPRTFEYGGAAMTFSPAGDPSGPADGFSGSLFIMGHDRLAYGEMPDGNQVAEISIPAPAIAAHVGDLPTAGILQDFHDVAAGHFAGLDEIPRVGMQYLDMPATGALIHVAWGQHLQDSPETMGASHAWFSPNLDAPAWQGAWHIGNQSPYSVNGYMLEIPVVWANLHADGRRLGTGRYRDGGWSGMGPALFAYQSWDAGGQPMPAGTRLSETTLLHYATSTETNDIEHCLDNYQHPDEWEGGAWITTDAGKSALLFAGTKGTGAKYWYGYVNPAGPETPCVEVEMVGEFTLCRLADGSPCPESDLKGCAGHNWARGWWSSLFDAQLILYDPADIAGVAAGEMESWEPQPYATIDIDEHLFLNPAGIEPELLGTGDQRRYRIGDVAYDRANGRLYVLELFADDAKPVVHVWTVG